MVDRFKQFSFSIFEISRCWHKLASDVMSRYDLKGPYAIYLVVLLNNPDGLTSAQLTEFCCRDKADVSRALSVMESSGIVYRERENAYRAKVFLTAKGIDAAEQVCRIASVAVEQGGKGVSDDERAVFYRALASITQNLTRLSQEGLPE